MRADQASIWYRRMSFVYGFAVWSALGSLFLIKRKQKLSDGEEDQEDGSRNETPLSTSENFDLAMETEPGKGLFVKTVVKHSENSVPVTQRILTFLKSWTGGPGPQA